jgi:hypothetical protein
MTQALADYEQHVEIIYDEFSTMLATRMQSTHDMVLTQWLCVVDSWNTIHRERVSPLYILSKLLHISSNKLTYSALVHAMNQGSFEAATSIVRDIRNSLDQLNGNFGLVPVDSVAFQVLTKKIQQDKGDLLNMARQNMLLKQTVAQRAEPSQDQLVEQITSRSGNAPELPQVASATAPASRAVVSAEETPINM